MSFSIRPSTAEDFSGVEALLRASYPALMAGVYDEAAISIMSRANPTLLSCGTYYVAVADETIVGCGGWTRQRPGTSISEPGVAHVRHFGTHPEWVRRGIGRAILERSENEARNAGIKTLECNASLNGEPFYAALGFERIGTRDVRLGSTLTIVAVDMRKLL